MTLFQAIVRVGALTAAVAGLAWLASGRRPVHYPPGILVTREPEQTPLPPPQAPLERSGWTLLPLARYSIEGRVLGIKQYAGDAIAELAPYDLVLGWGRMSDEAVLERLDISQEDRIYRWKFWGDPPIPEPEIMTHSSSNHLIPADEGIRKKISRLRAGALVHIGGLLVEATHPRANRPWRSSLTRDDTGDGACEIILVHSITESLPPR